MTRRVQLVLGLLVVAAGVWMIANPLIVAGVLGRPPATAPQMINLRASWGGTVIGLGAFVAWLPAMQPWRRFVVGLLMWSMAGIGVARAAGFLLDGGPDALQWAWLITEVVIAAGCAFALHRWRDG